jgi:ATP-dependent DNA helicase RecG
MGLPINIDELLRGEIIESDRLEFKTGWNPLPTLHTICAFANDFENIGGGYIIIGVKAIDGVAQFPPVGIKKSSIDKIQQELLEKCNHLRPPYHPMCECLEYQGENIIVLWANAGDNRPYKAPDSLSKDSKSYSYYIRRYSSTVKVTAPSEERKLIELTHKIPFDDRLNQNANIRDLDRTLIREFLRLVKSDLSRDMKTLSPEKLATQLQIAKGSPEYFKPLNVGLLFFNRRPDRFFQGAETHLVKFDNDLDEDRGGSNFSEKIVRGPIHQQYEEVYDWIRNSAIEEKVIKFSDRPEALRIVTYPIAAIEEALANAYYHRSYEDARPIEIRLHPGHLDILSYPGPLPPIDAKALATLNITARDYRNRRIGDFLKELKLTEGRATGIPTIVKALKENGSPTPKFETDDERNFFLVRLFIHDQFKPPAGVRHSLTERILEFCLSPQPRVSVASMIGVPNNTYYFQKHILPLIDDGRLEYTIPETPRSGKQRYFTSSVGRAFLEQSKRSL